MTSQPLAKIETKKITVSINRIKEHDSNQYYKRDRFYNIFVKLKNKPAAIEPTIAFNHPKYFIVCPDTLSTVSYAYSIEDLDNYYNNGFLHYIQKEPVNFLVIKTVGVNRRVGIVLKHVETWEIRVNEEN